MKQYKYTILFLLCMLLGETLVAQQTVKMSAVKGTDYGVTYSLPITTIEIRSSYTKTTRKVGEFYQYAERYLNIVSPITKNETLYTLDKIEANTKGVVDKDNSYLVEFRARSTIAFATLSKDGLICAINDDYKFPVEDKPIVTKPTLPTREVNPQTYLSEEVLRAGSSAKQAELVAKQIYRLRESRNEILTGEADNMPPDGDAYKVVMNQLDEQEKALTAMFIGKEYVETFSHDMIIAPESEDVENKIIYRFSNKLGIVSSDDLSGAPVYLSLTNRAPIVAPTLTEKEQKDMDKKFSQGIIYNVPGKADLKILFNGKRYLDKECDIIQYGKQEVLATRMFENNKSPIKIIFYPELGAIKQIIE